MTRFGFPGAVTIVSVLDAKFDRIAGEQLGLLGLDHVVGVGRREHIGGAPWASWVTRSDEPAKLNSTVIPGCPS